MAIFNLSNEQGWKTEYFLKWLYDIGYWIFIRLQSIIKRWKCFTIFWKYGFGAYEAIIPNILFWFYGMTL